MISRRHLLYLSAGAVLTGCADTGPDVKPVVVADRRTAKPTPRRTTPKRTFSGLVPVLMHHRLVPSGGGEYDMTPQFFRAELERLRREKYFPIRTIDLVRGNFADLPPGRRPVVLTFDDSSPGQFGLTATGAVDPKTAVGMMVAFHKQYPDFPPVASFYINQNPFGLQGSEVARGLRRLVELGCEIGNHTLHHPNLRSLANSQVQAEIGGLSHLVTAAGVPAPRTLALPLGVHPRDRALLPHGGAGPTAYRNDAVLLVGANPSLSPDHKDFDPLAIPRIRCSSRRGPLEFDYWLDKLKS